MKTHLVFAIMTALLLVFVIGQEKTASLTFDTVITQARWLSEEPYEPTPPIQSKALNALDYDQYRKILWRPEFNLWRENGLPFQAGFFITGYTHDKPVTIFQGSYPGGRNSGRLWRISRALSNQ
jgi:glucans biosynthesis protein